MTVLEVGPAGVRVLSGAAPARSPVEPRLVAAALDWIDDPVGLYGDRPVAVADLWRAVMADVVGRQGGPVTIVHPDDWPGHRIRRVVASANALADEVTALRRSDWDPSDPDGAATAVTGDCATAGRGLRRRHRLPTAVFVTLAAGAALVGAVAVATGTRERAPGLASPAASPAETVVEGRLAVPIPRAWTVTRVTSGPGSPRLQANSPTDPDLAVHITQSHAPGSTPAQTAAVLRRVIADQPAGVFVDFTAGATAGDRPAVAYREVRPSRVVEWTVLQV
ncbi:MAG: type VII secretion-associated protein, partial [Mycobacterium sp.]|nr:type VII secretion-associated protein [Mycobacterium sp.]